MKRFQMIGVVVAVAATLAMGGCKKKDEAAPAAKTGDKTPTPDKGTATPDKGTPTPTPTPTPDKGTPTPTPTPTGEGVTIKNAVEKAGTSWTEEDSMTMDAKLSVKGQEAAMVTSESKKKKIEVLESNAEAVTKAKMSYTEYSKSQKMGPQAKTEGAEVVGKTYVVELKDGKVVVTADGGGEVSATEVELVQDDNKRFGKPDQMAKALEGMSFKIGEKVTLPPEKLAGMLGGDDKMVPSAITMTLVEMRGTNAVFAMDVTLKGAEGPLQIESTMKVTVLVDPATGRMLDMTMDGTMAFSGQVNGTGVLKGHKAAAY